MKEFFKNVICSFPIQLKILLAKTLTKLNKQKSQAIKEICNCHDSCFETINTAEFKNSLRECLSTMTFSAKETSNFIQFLYNDEINLISKGTINEDLPYIICVAKNEKDKLVHFFNHYRKIGNFNYIFIDNESTDGGVELMVENNATVYQCKEKFTTLRKVTWINKIFSTIPNNKWALLLDADELLVYDGYEKNSVNSIIGVLDNNNIDTCGAIMIDMFSKHSVPTEKYYENYVYFQNSFHEEKSFFFNSVYGGIREREFNPNKDRVFLLKKHPLTKKTSNELLISCHYIYPFDRNLNSNIYLGLLHYKLYDSEIEKYKQIAKSGSYGNGGGSAEYKTYIKYVSSRSYEDIFAADENTVLFKGTESIEKIACIKDLRELEK